MTSQQRDAIKEISPPWLSQGVNEKYMYNFGLCGDSVLEKLNQAMRAHMPGAGTPTANIYLGLDRLMTQGPVEANDSFVSRLTKAYESWQIAGNKQSVMSQALLYMAQYFSPNIAQVPRAVIVNHASGGAFVKYINWDTYYNTSDLNKPPAHKRLNFGSTNWAWDGAIYWWRNWLILFPDLIGPGPVFGAPGVLIGDETISIGFNVPATIWSPLRELMRLWKSANTWYQWIIVCMNGDGGVGGVGDDYSPNNTTIGGGNPTPDWGRWGVNFDGIYQPSRYDRSRFVDGTSIYTDCFVPTSV